MDDKQKVLLKSLYSAFPTLPTVKPREMFPRHPYHDIERQDIANTIGNVEWDRIPSSILKAEYAALHFFARRFYLLPACIFAFGDFRHKQFWNDSRNIGFLLVAS